MSLPRCLKMLCDFAPYQLSGVVYGTLLNQRSAQTALGENMSLPPYNAGPKAPVLYLKPRNTLAEDGALVQMPSAESELEIGASLGLIIGRAACNVKRRDAIDFVAGYLIVNDISVPHPNYYRPSIRYKARDGFCPLGPAFARAAVADPDALSIRVYIDGMLAQTSCTDQLIRPVAALLEAVTEFMTLSPGDVLSVGVAALAPRVRAGQSCKVEIDGLGSVATSFVAAS